MGFMKRRHMEKGKRSFHVSAVLDSEKLENKLAIFSSGLGSLFAALMRRVGDEMAEDARANAPFTDGSGDLRRSIGFIMRGRTSALSTRERFGVDTMPYAWARERGSYVEPKGGKEYMTFAIEDDEGNEKWVRLKSFRTKAQPYMMPVFKKYWRGGNAKGYAALAEALQREMTEKMMEALK